MRLLIWCVLLQVSRVSMSLPDISNLTESSGSDPEPSQPSCPVPDDAVLPSVAELSDEEDNCDAAPNMWRKTGSAKSRSTKSEDFKSRMTKEQNLRAILGRKCLRCRHNCMEKFSSTVQFAKLTQFRKEWVDLHKLDQDIVALCS